MRVHVSTGEDAISIDIADRVVRKILRDDASGGTRFHPLSGDANLLDGEEILSGLIYRYPLLNDSDKLVALTVYLGLGEIGVAMWETEFRVLQRIGLLRHPSLPELEGGGRVDAGTVSGFDSAAAYVRTRGYDSGIEGGVDMIARYFRTRPAEALRHFRLIADALALLHDHHIAHRNLWPGTLEVEADDDGERYHIRLARFEMSSMVSNLLRGRQIDSTGAFHVRKLYEAQDERFRSYAPPERLRFLESSADSADAGGPPGDVFSLAMVCAEWLLGPDLLADAPTGRRALLDFHERVRRQVHHDAQLPKGLADLLHRMLHPEPRERPEMHSVTSTISKNYKTFLNALSPSEVTRPYLVAYLPGKDIDILRKWGAINDPSTTKEGQEQLADLLARDLQGATVARSEEGAKPFIQNADMDVEERARNVLFGSEYVWFSHTLYRKGMAGMRHFERIQVLKYALPKAKMGAKLDRLRAESVGLPIHAVYAINGRSDVAVLERQSNDRPDWAVLFAHVAGTSSLTRKSEEYLEALDWYLDYQSAQLRAREYAFSREDADRDTRDPADRVALRSDRKREQGRAHQLDPMCTMMIKSSSRPGMGDFFIEEANRETVDLKIDVYKDSKGYLGEWVGVYSLVEKRGQATVVLNAAHGAVIPDQGWMRVAADGATAYNLRNQALARSELSNNALLLRQLVDPERSVGRAAPSTAGGELRGEGRSAVRAMLETEPMFALQGPPGTGKTEVTSQAIADYLDDDRLGRVLVSAQSHHVLDNLARRVLRKIGALDGEDKPMPTNWIVLRVAGDKALHNVNDVVKPFTEDAYVPALINDIQRRVDHEWRGPHRTDNPTIARILENWRAALDHSDIELRMRVRRSANLVFSTTGGATSRRLVELGSDEPFDWVLVEEAAKAWPTELVLPLVRGLRWTMVGDQAQIGAYDQAGVERFLESCHDDPDRQVSEWWGKKEAFLKAFNTFGRMFDADRSEQTTMELTEQRRMREPIANMVSEAFYANRSGGGLITKRADHDHDITHPNWLRGQALVWLDTGETQQAAGNWTNQIEANLVANLVRSLRFEPGRPGWGGTDRLAIITPYRAQNNLIRELLPEAENLIWTVDSFQGREADIVIVSLVRDREDQREDPYAALGHVAEPRRANVLLSRARDLLVIVGRLARYERCGVQEWERAANAAKAGGRVVDMRTVGAS